MSIDGCWLGGVEMSAVWPRYGLIDSVVGRLIVEMSCQDSVYFSHSFIKLFRSNHFELPSSASRIYVQSTRMVTPLSISIGVPRKSKK